MNKDKRLLLWSVVISILLICVVWVLQDTVRRFFLEREVVSARQNALPEFDSTRNKMIDELLGTQIIDKATPAYASLKDSCSERGVNNQEFLPDTTHYQLCELSAVELYETEKGPSDLTALMTGTDVGKPCAKLRFGDLDLVYFDASMINASNMHLCSMVAFSTDFTDDKNVKVISSIKSSDVDMRKRYIVLRFTDDYFYKEIGCGISILCNQPYGYPVTGF